MPLFPYDSSMSETDIRAVMLYPGDNEFNRKQRPALQARFRQKALRPYLDAGGREVPHDLMALIIEHAEDPVGVEERLAQGLLMGKMVAVLHSLHHRAPELIFWNRAVTMIDHLFSLGGQTAAVVWNGPSTSERAKTSAV